MYVEHCHNGILGASVAKNPPAMQEKEVRFLGQVDPPWKRKWQPIPIFLSVTSYITEEPGGLQSGVVRVGHDLATKPAPS